MMSPQEIRSAVAAGRIDDVRAAVAGRTSRLEQVPVEFRAEPETDGDDERITLRGHAAVFERLSEDMGGWREKIKRGAFRKALDADQDVRLLINHDPWPVLARTRSNTLELREDPRGLHVYADVVPTQTARDLRASMQRGDIDQMSFGFTVASDRWIEENGEIVREVREIDRLFDVSVVSFPAYPQTDATARSAEPEPEDQVEELAADEAEPAEAVDETSGEESAPVGDLAEVRARRSVAERIVRRLEGVA